MRKELIDDFIVRITKNNISLSSIIPSSIKETNSFFIEKQLIEHAEFFDLIKIFKYLLI